MHGKIKISALLAGLCFLTACGDQSSDDSQLNAKAKKFLVICDGAVFNDADPFGKRVTLSASGTQTYKAGEFDANKNQDELKKVALALRTQCNGGYSIVNTSICDQIDVVNTDLAFHSLFHSVNGFTYKGSYSCSLKEKS